GRRSRGDAADLVDRPPLSQVDTLDRGCGRVGHDDVEIAECRGDHGAVGQGPGCLFDVGKLVYESIHVGSPLLADTSHSAPESGPPTFVRVLTLHRLRVVVPRHDHTSDLVTTTVSIRRNAHPFP